MDEIILQPQLHLLVGALVLLTSLVTVVTTGRGALSLKRFGRTEQGVFIAAQLALMVQIMIGIKLLDQGIGTLQKYVHYIGGAGALGLLVLYYWLPKTSEQDHARKALWVSVASLVFVALAFFVGGMYARG
ncbi:hypothetical protein Dcar01_02915 [Deinococcus carri]|uniref:Uncharacterized protein n=1 Tax=Deinococcus carri TaxID=1211323 RepID=A0ABP9WD63_9DEIO